VHFIVHLFFLEKEKYKANHYAVVKRSISFLYSFK